MIVIPMVGASSRFFKAGYAKPKYQLPLWGHTVFFWVMSAFAKYFESQKFLFIVRSDYKAKAFVVQQATEIGIKNYDVIVLDAMTQGQADTVAKGVELINHSGPMAIFNIDTIRYGFDIPNFAEKCDGYLEVFKGEGDHWSFVEADVSGNVLRTTEKERISDLCSDGLYYFSSADEFLGSFDNAVKVGLKQKGEYYIAPLYNHLIDRGLDIKFLLIDEHEIDFCGTPEEYEYLVDRGGPK